MTGRSPSKLSEKESAIISAFDNDFIILHTLDKEVEFHDFPNSYAKNITDIALGRHNSGYYLEMPGENGEKKILRDLSIRHSKLIGFPCVATNGNPNISIPTYDVTENLGFIINPVKNAGLKFLFFVSTDAWSEVYEDKGKPQLEFYKDFCRYDLFKKQLPEKYKNLPHDRVKISVDAMGGRSEIVHDVTREFLNSFKTKQDWYDFVNGEEKRSSTRTQINWNELMVSFKGKFSGIYFSPDNELNVEKDRGYLMTKAIALAGAYYTDVHEKLPILEYCSDEKEKLRPIKVTPQLKKEMEEHFNKNKFVSSEEQQAIFQNFDMALLMQEQGKTTRRNINLSSFNLR